MDNKIKDNWINRVRCSIATQVAILYQNSSGLLDIFFIGERTMDFLWWLEKTISPYNTPYGYIDALMIEVIRKRMRISPEEFDNKINEIKKEKEREELGLPK